MEEKRLIDVSKENVKAALGKYTYYPDEIWKFTAMTEKFPTVDAVEVVLCKDCKYRVFDWQIKSYYCSHPNGLCGEMDGTRYRRLLRGEAGRADSGRARCGAEIRSEDRVFHKQKEIPGMRRKRDCRENG